MIDFSSGCSTKMSENIAGINNVTDYRRQRVQLLAANVEKFLSTSAVKQK
jgi:hypothetical protein